MKELDLIQMIKCKSKDDSNTNIQTDFKLRIS